MPGGLVRRPRRTGDADLEQLFRQFYFHGGLKADPETVHDGEAWLRLDLSPPQLRARVNGATYYIAFTQVP